MKPLKINLLILFTALLSACGTTTNITGSYKAPGVTQLAYKKIFVSALTEKAAVRQSVEKGIADYLATKGISAVTSTAIFPPDFHSSGNDKDKDLVLQKIREAACDALFTIALIDKENEARYVPGSGAYPINAYGHYGTFGAYYNYGYGSFYSPGYYTNDKIYYLETNLYDATTEKLVWSAQSKTYDPTSLDSFLQGYLKAVNERVVKDGLVPAPAK